MTMTKRDDTSMAEQNAEIRRWAEENGLTLGSRLGQQSDAVERVAPRVPVVEVTVRIDEDVYEAAMLRATYDGYDNASEVVEAALREWARGYYAAKDHLMAESAKGCECESVSTPGACSCGALHAFCGTAWLEVRSSSRTSTSTRNPAQHSAPTLTSEEPG